MWARWTFQFKIIVFIVSSLIADVVNGLTDDEDIVLITLLGESRPDLRVRRAADGNLPDHLQFGVPVNGENVVLDLRKSSLLPVATADVLSVEKAYKPWQNAAVYTDTSRASAMIVKKGGIHHYTLDGFFAYANKEWSLEPVKTNTTEDRVQKKIRHRIFLATAKNETVSFTNDIVSDTQERPEQIDTAESQAGRYTTHHSRLNTTREDNQRHKRAITQHVIEIALIVDYKDYSKWRSLFGADSALSAMRLWYTFVAESINIRFQSIRDPDFSMSTSVTVLKILTASWEARFISQLPNAEGEFSGPAGLHAFKNWYPKQSDIPASDHYMLITGYDIIGSSGIAYKGRMCTSYSLSITENGFTGTLGGVASHEIGHSFGVVHDVDTNGVCTDDDQYVMSTVFTTPVSQGHEGNPWKFSPCSIQAIKNYLRGVRCTLPEYTTRTPKLQAPAQGQRAGELLSKDEQCVLLFRDSKSSFCHTIQIQNGGMESLCGGMYCSIPNDPMASCRTIVPQEFTPCGLNKWCVMGHCTDMYSVASMRTSSATGRPVYMRSNTAYVQTPAPRPDSPSPVKQTRTQARHTVVTYAPRTTTAADVQGVRGASPNILDGYAPRTTTAAVVQGVRGASPNILDGYAPRTTTAAVVQGVRGASPNILDGCNYFIHVRKSTEWWSCIRKLLDSRGTQV